MPTAAAGTPRVDDETFLRRVSLDVIGQPPTPAEVTAFVLDPAADKRARLVETLDQSADPVRKQQAANWRVLKSLEAGQHAVVYIFAFDPVVAGADYDPVKILGEGEISKKVNVTANRFSASAKEKIEKAGGTCTQIPDTKWTREGTIEITPKVPLRVRRKTGKAPDPQAAWSQKAEAAKSGKGKGEKAKGDKPQADAPAAEKAE